MSRSTAALLVVALLTGSSAAATFRVNTQIYEGANVKPFAQHHVLFDQGLMIDLPQIDPRFVTVYDPAQNRITLLDRQSQVQTSISIDDLVKYTAATRARAAADNKQGVYGLDATVADSNRVIGYSIAFGKVEYHMTTQKPEAPKKAIDYGQFVLLASRLSIARPLGGPPPFARMTLAQHVAGRGEIPLETTLIRKNGKQESSFRVTHKLDDLSDKDRQQISEVQGMMSLYKNVAFNKFPQ